MPPERLVKVLLRMALYSVRREWPLCEPFDLNLLFRWFLDRQPILEEPPDGKITV